MSNESSPKCPQCGTPLREDAPKGLCPNCLMALNLKTETLFTGDTLAAQPPLPPEQIAPHFPQLEILECLGRGGMGVVYKARQKTLNRLVALKLLAPERVRDAKFAERFTREAQALAALNHPNIVTIHDFGQAGGFYFLLMEFVDGLNLRQLLRARKFTPEEALAIVPPLCDALQFAHDRGIVHRDIKPENLLLDKTGRIKVADFGIARMLATVNGSGDAGGSTAPENATHTAAGTPGYSAPEQQTDPQHVDSRADIYSLGVVFYELLTGELPGKRIEPPSRKVQIDVRLDEVVLRALEKSPELRYQQVSEVKTMVETIAATPRASGESAPASDSPPKVSLCYVSTPEHLRTLPGRLFYHFQAKGDLRLDKETLTFDSGWSAVKIPLSSIGALALGGYPASFFTFIKLLMMPGNYLAVTFTGHGVSRTLLFTLAPPLNTVWTRVKYHLTDPNKKVREHMLVLGEWASALQEAVQARTGRRLLLGHHDLAKTPPRWTQAIGFFLCVAFIAMLGKRPLLEVLNGLLPGPVTTALAFVNSLPGAARVVVGSAISLIDAGLCLFLITLLVQLLIKMSVAVGPLSRRISVQFANSFPPQRFDENSWLAMVDGGKYAESWERAAHSFQRAISREEWVARLEKVRRPLGKVISRKLRSLKIPRSLKDAAVGTRLEQRFNTSFDGLPAAVETVTCSRQPDGSWRTAGYHIRTAGCDRSRFSRAAIVVRWVARGLALAGFLFILMFILAEGFPAFWKQPSAVQVELAGTVTMLIGLLLGWKREGWGAALIAAGWSVFFIIERGRPPWPFTAFLVVAALYAFGWWQKRK